MVLDSITVSPQLLNFYFLINLIPYYLVCKLCSLDMMQLFPTHDSYCINSNHSNILNRWRRVEHFSPGVDIYLALSYLTQTWQNRQQKITICTVAGHACRKWHDTDSDSEMYHTCIDVTQNTMQQFTNSHRVKLRLL